MILLTRSCKIALWLLIPLVFLTTGCWDRLDLNKRALVAGLGLDSSSKEDEIVVSAQIIDPSKVKTPQSAGAGGSGAPFWVVTDQSKTLFEAIRSMTQITSLKLFFPHNQIVIFGEDLAQKGLKGHFDLLVRNYEVRETNWILVAEGKAQDILETETKISSITAFFIRDLVTERRYHSQVAGVNIKDFAAKIVSKTTAPIASYIRVEDLGKEKRLVLSHTAVFDHGLKMVGKLDLRESRGLLWVLGQVESGIVMAENPRGDCNYSLEILQAKSKVTPEFKAGKPKVKVQVNVVSNLGEVSCPQDLQNPEVWKAIEGFQNTAIKQEITAALDKAQALKADIFGFGEAFYKKYPRVWQDLGPSWLEIFPNLEVEVSVESAIRIPGLVVSDVFAKRGD